MARIDGTPVGHLDLRWTSRDAALTAHLDGIPEVGGLSVSQKSQGIGTALILEAERIAAARGHAALGIAVGLDNARARKLYERPGYVDWRHGTFEASWTWTDDAGVEHHDSELCDYLVKAL